MPRNVVFLYFENTVLIVIRLHVLSVYSFDVSVATSTFSTAGMMHDPDYIPYKKRVGNTQKNISLWPSLLCTLDTIVLFEYFTLDRVFKISRRRML